MRKNYYYSVQCWTSGEGVQYMTIHEDGNKDRTIIIKNKTIFKQLYKWAEENIIIPKGTPRIRGGHIEFYRCDCMGCTGSFSKRTEQERVEYIKQRDLEWEKEDEIERKKGFSWPTPKYYEFPENKGDFFKRPY